MGCCHSLSFCEYSRSYRVKLLRFQRSIRRFRMKNNSHDITLFTLCIAMLGVLAACGPTPASAPPTAAPAVTAAVATIPAAPAATSTTIAPAATPTVVTANTPASAATTAASSKIILKDDFSGAIKYLASNGQKGFGSAAYDNGVYRVVAEKKDFLNFYGGATEKQCSGDGCKYPDQPTENIYSATVEVDVKKVSGPNDGLFGIACRHSEIVSPGNFYGAFISADGRHYSVSLTSDSGSGVTYLLGGQEKGTPHPAIKQGDGVVNHLRLDCTDKTVALWVNGLKVTEAALDSAPFVLSAKDSKGVALLALTRSAPRLELEFDNLVVAEPPAPGPVAAAPSGQIIYPDDFSVNDQTWLSSKAADWQIGYAGGAYQISLVKADQSRVVTPFRMQYHDTSAAIDGTLTAGPEPSFFGLTCRHVGQSYYEFLVGADGSYLIGANVKGKASDLVTWTPSAAIKKGVGQLNRLRADCVGDTLTMYVNDQKINQVKDTSLTWGAVGLEAGTTKAEGGTLFTFDNLAVSRP